MSAPMVAAIPSEQVSTNAYQKAINSVLAQEPV